MKKTYSYLIFALITFNAFSQWVRIVSNTSKNLNDIMIVNNRLAIVGDSGVVLLAEDTSSIFSKYELNDSKNFTTVASLSTTDTILIAGKGQDLKSTIYYTTDFGATWQRDNSIDNISIGGSDFELSDNKIEYLNQSLYQTTNITQPWKKQYNLSPSIAIFTIKFQKAGTDKILTFGNHDNMGTQSYTGYSLMKAKPYNKWFRTFENYPNAGTIINSTSLGDTIYVIANKQNRYLPTDVYKLWKIYNCRLEYLELFPGEFDTFGNFNSVEINDSIGFPATAIQFLTPQLAYATAQNGNIYKTTDGGISWTIDYMGNQPLNKLFLVDDNKGIAIGKNGTIVRKSLLTRTKTNKQIDCSIFPTLAQNVLYLKYDKATLPIQSIKIYNNIGQQQIEFFGDRNEISIETLPSGLFFLQVNTTDATAVYKFIKE